MTEAAERPEDLPRFLVERLISRDPDGLAALYEENAVMALPDGNVAVGRTAIGDAFRAFLASGPSIEPGSQARAPEERRACDHVDQASGRHHHG